MCSRRGATAAARRTTSPRAPPRPSTSASTWSARTWAPPLNSSSAGDTDLPASFCSHAMASPVDGRAIVSFWQRLRTVGTARVNRYVSVGTGHYGTPHACVADPAVRAQQAQNREEARVIALLCPADSFAVEPGGFGCFANGPMSTQRGEATANLCHDLRVCHHAGYIRHSAAFRPDLTDLSVRYVRRPKGGSGGR